MSKWRKSQITIIQIEKLSNKAIKDKEKERYEKLNEFENYLLQVKQYDPEIESLVDADQSREELERQVMDNNYMREKIEEHRMNESMQSDRSNKPVKAIAFDTKSKPNLYKPPIPKITSEKSQEPAEPENIDSIEARIAKQLEEFHKFKNLALEE